jgi:hypothetical protein
MTEQDKKLLLIDLSARFPYGVIVRHADHLVDSDGNYTGQFWYKRGYLYDICRIDNITTTIIESEGSDEEGNEHICDLERSLPYLRPMSSMTEEEIKEFYKIENIIPKMGYICPSKDWHFTTNGFDWLNANHFDYRGLIEKGLAIEVTDKDNPYIL